MGIPGLSGGGSYDNTRLNNVRVTQSSQGKPLPVVLGVGRVHQTLLWNDGLVSWQSDQGGKGGGEGGRKGCKGRRGGGSSSAVG